MLFVEMQKTSAVSDGAGGKVESVSMVDMLADKFLGPDELPPVPRVGTDEVLIQFCMN